MTDLFRHSMEVAISAKLSAQVSPIFLGLNITKSDIFGSPLTDIMAMIFFGHKTSSN